MTHTGRTASTVVAVSSGGDAARITELERRLDAKERTIAALMRRAEQQQASDASPLAVLHQNASLERVVERKTAELESERQELKHALEELRSTQVMLLQAQKLESIGQLAAGIAHEINTPTHYVSDNIVFLKMAFDSVSRVLDLALDVIRMAQAGTFDAAAAQAVHETATRSRMEFLREQVPLALKQSEEGLGRIATIVGAMKEFSHPSPDEKIPANLGELIDTTITVARNEWKYVAEIETSYDPSLLPVPCIRNALSQAILNLVVNAAHALEDSAGRRQGGKGLIRVVTERVGDVAMIRITDNGTGIPESIRDRVFDPFFTTKPVGKGTGQGLAITWSAVVDKHGGRISVESEVGVGTTFRIELPLGDTRETV
jgi:two-component system, NtrC family, sensor kinase